MDSEDFEKECMELDRDDFREATKEDFSFMDEYYNGQDIGILSFENILQKIRYSMEEVQMKKT